MLVAPRDASLQEGSCSRQERVVLVTAEADVFTISDSYVSGPHHVSGKLKLQRMCPHCLCVIKLLLVHW